MAFCTKCGAQVEDGVKFCTTCGAPMESEQVPTPDQSSQPAAQNGKSNGKAIAAMVLGIIGLVGGWIPVVQYVTTASSIVAIVLGALARKECAAQGKPAGMATAGLVMGIVALAIGLTAIICVVAALCAAGGAIGGLSTLY